MERIEAGGANARPARSKSERAYIEALNAAQWLVRVMRSYAPAAGEDVSLLFDPATRRVITPEVAPGIRLGLHLPRLVLQFEEKGEPTPHALDLDDRSTTEVEAWLLAELLHRGFDRDRFDKYLPYEWSHLMSGDEIKYTSHDLADALDRLAQRLAAAAACLTEARKSLGKDHDAEPPRWLLVAFQPMSCRVGLAVEADDSEIEAFLGSRGDAEGAICCLNAGAVHTLGIEINAMDASSDEGVASRR